MIGGLFFVSDISPRVYSCSRPRWRSRLLSVCVDEQAGERPLAKWHQGIWESVEMLRRHGVKLVWMWQISVCWQHRHKDPSAAYLSFFCQQDISPVRLTAAQCLYPVSRYCVSSPRLGPVIIDYRSHENAARHQVFFLFFLWTVYILFVQFKNETFAPTTLNKVTGVRLL